jgi:hypothetical protein
MSAATQRRDQLTTFRSVAELVAQSTQWSKRHAPQVQVLSSNELVTVHCQAHGAHKARLARRRRHVGNEGINPR